MNMVNNTYNSKEGMIRKVREIKGKTKLKFFLNISDYYSNMNITLDEDTFLEILKVIVEFIMKYYCY